MIKIESEYGTVEADSFKEAEKELKRLKKITVTKQKKDSENYEYAEPKAKANAYWIYSKYFSDGKFPKAWRIRKFDEQHLSVTLKEKKVHNDTFVLHFYQHSPLEIQFASNQCKGYLENGTGYPMAFFLVSDDGTEDVRAVGVHENQVVTVSIPGMLMEYFK